MSQIATQEDAIALQLAFKPADLRAAMVAIVEVGLWSSQGFWPDEISFQAVPADSANAIGNAFKTLLRAGLIQKTGAYRNSSNERQKGRIIWCYHLCNTKLAHTFLRANNVTPVTGQMEMSI